MRTNKAKVIKSIQQSERENLSKEQIAYERWVNKGRYQTDIENLEREIKFKENQLQNDIEETFETIITEEGRTITRSGYKNYLKPRFLIENELAIIRQKKAEKEKLLQNLKEQEEKDVDST